MSEPETATNDQNCVYCHGQRVESMATGEEIACRMCLGTGRGPVPYGNDMGHEARLRELKRIAELVEQRDTVLSAWELVRPWFEEAAATVDGLTEAMGDEKRAEYLTRIKPARDANAAVFKMLAAEVQRR